MKVLVVGGAGYIGSHTVREMLDEGKHEIVVMDNLSKGHPESVPKGITLEIGDIHDSAFLDVLFTKHKFDSVMFFAASISVGDSVADPLAYFENNVAGPVNFLKAMQKYKVKYFIFSSTAALFGEPDRVPIGSDDRTHPVNPYGDTKLMVEHILRWCDEAFGLKFVCLRYFNACGAHPSGDIGEHHEPETHLIPIILEVALGKREKISVFGNDYPTEDGTCIRDYVHVCDLASAHIKALDYLEAGNPSNRFNLGSGAGFSVRQIIDAARKVTGQSIPEEVKPRRAGDPPVLVASSDKAENGLGWVRKFQNVEDIVATAWNWHKKHPAGYTH
ncbi:hypothetical protein BJ742DRAFT_808623 [Cladochytrium replicatum]|nr:hypothetical protein BJ742DRAFT_808623 [Cladochytrium replicatum]